MTSKNKVLGGANRVSSGPVCGASAPSGPRLLSLFSGIGGFELGLERAGFVTVAQCEVSPKCRHLLNHHWPDVPCYDDVQTLTAERLAQDGIEVDAICGGFPCQDISLAGKGAGLDGARSGLFFHIVRLAREILKRTGRLPLLVLENVSALLVRGFGAVARELAALGYDLWWDCIPASAVGAHHRRDRLWIVAYPRGEQHEGFGDALRRAVAAELSRAFSHTTRGGDGCDGGGPVQVADLRGAHGSAALADAAGERRREARQLRRDQPPQRAAGRRQAVGDADCAGLSIAGDAGAPGEGASGVEPWPAPDGAGWWAVEPAVGRVAHGVPARVDRLHGLGNAVVPQIPEALGRAILTAWREGQIARAA